MRYFLAICRHRSDHRRLSVRPCNATTGCAGPHGVDSDVADNAQSATPRRFILVKMVEASDAGT